jgi:hypothetical protein
MSYGSHKSKCGHWKYSGLRVYVHTDKTNIRVCTWQETKSTAKALNNLSVMHTF